MKHKKKIIKEIKSWVLMILVVFFIASLLNSKVFAKVQVEQHSMENTLFPNQQLIVNKFNYNFKEPERGEIIIFLESEEKGTFFDDTLRTIDSFVSKYNKDGIEKHKRLVKRVIGIAGDEVDIKDGSVYLNGKKLEEPYVNGKTLTGTFNLPVKVGENELFVLGDNRLASTDSREFGLINYNQVEGNAVYRVYPFNQIGKIK